ncbi:MAG: head-tail joining protein [Burkholderiales bacterium]
MDFSPHMAKLFATLGRKVGYFPLDEDEIFVDGIFEAPPSELLGLESNRPAISCLMDQVANPRHGDRFELDGRLFKVVGVEKDEIAGVVKLKLEAP